jgi:hypothetical protein
MSEPSVSTSRSNTRSGSAPFQTSTPGTEERASRSDLSGVEVYVQAQLAATQAYTKRLWPLVKAPQDPSDVVDKTSPQAIKERLERVEKYARWRYQGFLSGEVGSL